MCIEGIQGWQCRSMSCTPGFTYFFSYPHKTDETGRRLLEESCYFTGIRLLVGFIIPKWRQEHLELYSRIYENLRAKNRWAKQSELEDT
jgi:hypothetical protein